MKLRDLFGYEKPNHLLTAKAAIFGLECEIESVGSINISSGKIAHVEDGSLRNNGREFLTVPSNREEALELFHNIHAEVEFNRPEEKFSQRTSIHVHMNCLSLETVEISNIIRNYAMLEPLFFMMVDSERLHNIHCVPLSETFLPKFYSHDLKPLIKRWHKYTALNIKPLSDLGTIEFRHMHGHDDTVLLNEWLTVLENLFLYGREFSAESLSIDNVTKLYTQIFGRTRINGMGGALPTLLSNNIIDLKKSLVNN